MQNGFSFERLRESMESKPVETIDALAEPTVYYISDLAERDLELVTDSCDAAHLRSLYDLLESEAYDGFLVREDDGDYAEVWGFFGTVPRLDKRVYRVH